MKKRGLLWALCAALLLAAAFLGPRLLLRQEERGVLDRPHLLDASAYLLESGSGDLLKKLRVLSDGNTEVLTLTLLDSDARSSQSSLTAELETLAEYGAVPASLPRLAADSDTVTVKLQCVVNPALSLLFEVYDFYLPREGISARMDAATGKLLSLSCRGNPVMEETDLLYTRTDRDWAAEQSAAWARYFGLTLADTDSTTQEQLEEHLYRNSKADYLPGIPVLRATLRDGAGEETVFCLYSGLEFGDCVFAWHTETEDPMLALQP